MPGIIVVGLQWGDEGKGKVVDLLSAQAFHIVRSQGGNNAGHTILAEGHELALHLIPSGIIHKHAQSYIAGGCLVDPKVLLEEISKLEAAGISVIERLHLSMHCHLIFPFHRELDRLYEERKGKGAIGTTGRGIGPCSSDRAARTGIRVADLLSPEIFHKRLEALVELKNLERTKIFEVEPIDFDEVYSQYVAYGELLKPIVKDVEGRIASALIRDESVLFEGAHGTLLDQLFGSYPYVTSSLNLASGVAAGAAVGPTKIDEVYGVLKAYTTRVGGGPLPTAVPEDDLSLFQQSEEFREVGTTTGRARRIGWLDLVLAKYAAEINGVGVLALTKLDVLDELEEIQLCVGYEIDGMKIDKPPPLSEDLARVVPIYESMPGWQCSTKEVTKIRELPANARAYIERIEDFCNVSIGMVSVGPRREQTIEIDQDFM